MHVGRNRIFVGNLPPLINENDIKEQFGQYGNVVSIEIKHRKENANTNENVSPVFAFVSIETDKNQLYECFESLPNYNWDGYYVKLELAKESFLERLKREREEAQNTNTKAPIIHQTVDNTNNFTPSTSTSTLLCTTNTNNKKKVYSSGASDSSDSSGSSESSSDSSEDENDKPPRKNGITPKQTIDKPDPDLIIKNNKNKHLTNGKITIESVNSTPIHVIKIKQNGLQKDGEKLTPADEKRLNSLYKLKESQNQQKSLIKNALLQIDTSNTNKIVFDDDGKQSRINTNKNSNNNKRKQNFNYDDNQYYKKERVSLFSAADNEEDDNINFNIKNQFEGQKGQRLLELQTRYTNDKRFTLDSRFADEDNYDEVIINETNEEDEKQKQFEILESVIGKKIYQKTPAEDSNKKNMPRGMLRYDPTNLEHSKFEIKDKPSTSTYTTNNYMEENEEKIEETPVEVSKEKFYKVTDNLKQAFKESQGFSLLNMFGRADEDKPSEQQNTESTIINKKIDSNQRNPFRYDSSESEDDDDDTHKKFTNQIKHNENTFAVRNIRNISGEKFFFQNEDERLKDGLIFLKKFGGNSSAEKFMETRREIKQILRSKLRNVQRNNRPFRKKIGQHKHIKIKKAKKN